MMSAAMQGKNLLQVGLTPVRWRECAGRSFVARGLLAGGLGAVASSTEQSLGNLQRGLYGEGTGAGASVLHGGPRTGRGRLGVSPGGDAPHLSAPGRGQL